ncbi:hypothetical protein [Aureivirga sp. CE67]|uniref:hypothetical protein n=1 Tax=Aureivirga sp. CE67 TaxID=1788983 RepID=UPI0018CBEE3B|nr:hypothetical protein [Aureivirga sp. CE67]
MTKDNFQYKLKSASNSLIETARKHAWNSISENCLYILSEYNKNDSTLNSKEKKVKNLKKTPISLEEIIPSLEKIYDDLYEIDLIFFKSKSKFTIIEILYIRKSSFEKVYYETIKNNSPMLHCKVQLPPYLKQKEKKFDINWHLGGLRHQWNSFCWKYLINQKLHLVEGNKYQTKISKVIKNFPYEIFIPLILLVIGRFYGYFDQMILLSFLCLIVCFPRFYFTLEYLLEDSNKALFFREDDIIYIYKNETFQFQKKEIEKIEQIKFKRIFGIEFSKLSYYRISFKDQKVMLFTFFIIDLEELQSELNFPITEV